MGTRLRWWDRLNNTFFPVFGPAQLGPGPGGEKQTAARPRVCPLCGSEMAEHTIHRSGDGRTATRMSCP